MTENDIIDICKKYNIKNYTINPDMSVDVDGDVKLYNYNLRELPLTFGKVSGIFYCYGNNLTTLKGCPNHVGEYFSCEDNKLTTLKDLPMNFYIGSDFYCYDNNITSPIEFGRLFFGTFSGEIDTGYSDVNEFLNEHKNTPKKDLPKILSELRKIQL